MAGSSRFGSLAPADTSADDSLQNQLMFVNLCPFTLNEKSCNAFSHGVFNFGLHAGMLEFANQARLAYATINATLNDPLSAPAYAQQAANAAGTNNPLLFNHIFPYLDKLNTNFHNDPNTWIQNVSDTYLAEALSQSGQIYVQAIGNKIDGIFAARVGTLVAFIVLCFVLFVFFYNPMCWQLDSEQKRTSAMLLMIPADVMERIPSIRAFVQRLDVKNV